MTLNQDLVPDYFVLMRGAAGNYSSGTDWYPDDNYARIYEDPFGNFAAGSSAANQLRLARGAVGNVWTGQVTVVECIADCVASGFTLVRVNMVTMTSGQTSATDTTGGAWGSGDLGQIGLYGGSYGGGVRTTEFGVANHKTAWARIWPSGSDTVNLSRSNTGPGAITGTTEFTVYVVQWGSEWTIQRANVTGSNGGDGMNLTTHYNTASINSVNRADTWVIAYGEVDSNNLVSGWDGHSWTLGDGVNQNTTETLVAVGSEAGVQRDVEVYVHTHPNFFNQYIFGPDGVAPGIVTGNLSGIATIQNPTTVETHNANDTVGRRFILVANTQAGTGTAFPRSIVWGHLDFNTGGRWQRSQHGQPGTYWMQTPDFGEIGTFNPAPQFARPDSDIATATWTSTEAAHWHAIDERSADDDTTYTESPTNPANTEDVEFGLRSVTDPTLSTNHIVRYKWRNAADAIGDATIDVTVELLQGVTVIASKSHLGIDHLNWISDSFTLSAAEADAITDYTDLRIKFDITFNAGGSGDRNARVTWAELQVPGAP